MTPDIPSRYLRKKPDSPSEGSKGYKVTSSTDSPSFFNPTGRDEKLLLTWKTVYKQGGLASQCVDAYPYFMLSNGWTIEGQSKRKREQCEEFARKVNLRKVLRHYITDSVVSGRPFVEIGFGRGESSKKPVSLTPLPPETMRVEANLRGDILGYTQIIKLSDGKAYKQPFLKKEILSEPLFPMSGELYGISLVGRALDDIMHDAKISEATAIAVMRHGFPKYHIKVGMEGEVIDPIVLNYYDTEFKNLGPKSEICTPFDVEIINLDKDALPDVQNLNDWSQSRMCISMGIPEVIMGMGRGSTEASSYVEMTAFYDKVSMLQDVIEVEVNKVFDAVTGDEGAVTFSLNDANPEDEEKIANWIYKLVTMNPMEPGWVAPRKFIQDKLGINPDLYPPEPDDDKFGTPETSEGEKQEYFNAINGKRPNKLNPKDQAFGGKKNDTEQEEAD